MKASRAVLAVALVGALRVAAADPPDRATPDHTTPTDNPVTSAIAWVEAVRDKDLDRLTALTRFPVAVDVDANVKGCRNKRAKNATVFRAVAQKCVVGDRLFQDSIPPRTSEIAQEWKVVALADLPKSLRRFRKQLAPLKGYKLVSGALPGDGITYQAVVAVAPDGKVSAVFADGEPYE
jgi:hypothetical protein